MVKLTVSDLTLIQDAAKKFLAATKGRYIFAFYGSMGAGKTTFIKAICHELGVVDVVTSPTFTLVNEYLTAENKFVYHFDFYRIKKIEEVFDFGFEEYLFSGRYCFIEWPEMVEDLLPENTTLVKLEVNDKHERSLEIKL